MSFLLLLRFALFRALLQALLELACALAQRTSEARNLRRPKQQKDDCQDDDQLRKSDVLEERQAQHVSIFPRGYRNAPHPPGLETHVTV